MNLIATGNVWWKQLHWQILIAMVIGIGAGMIGGEPLADNVEWIGQLFMKLLRMVIVPLVFTSIVAGVASVGSGRAVGRLFSKTLGYYVLTSLLAIATGLMLVNIFRPGEKTDVANAIQADMPDLKTPSSPVDILMDIVPANVIEAAAGTQMLAIIFFSIILGLAIVSLPEKPQATLRNVFDAFFHAMMKITTGVIMVAPIGVFGLIATLVGRTGFETFGALGLYMFVLSLGLTIHLFVTLPLVLFFLGRINPIVHFRNMIEPLVTAFSTASSGATLPVTMQTVETKVGVSSRVSSFTLPMGATVNMDGTALYECLGAIFIAQALGVSLGFTDQVIVVFTALLASIGAAAIPSAGLVVIFIVLEAVGLTGAGPAFIVGAMLAIDRPLDMFRTAVNVYSDSCGAAIIARSEGEENVDTHVVT